MSRRCGINVFDVPTLTTCRLHVVLGVCDITVCNVPTLTLCRLHLVSGACGINLFDVPMLTTCSHDSTYCNNSFFLKHDSVDYTQPTSGN